MGWGAHALPCSCCLSGVWQVLSWSIAWRWFVAVVLRWFCCHFFFVSFPAVSTSVLAFVVWPGQVFCLFGEPAADATLYAMMAETRPHAALPWLALVHTFAVLSATLWREMPRLKSSHLVDDLLRRHEHMPTAEREDMAQLAPPQPPHSRKETQTRQKLLRNAHSAFCLPEAFPLYGAVK